MRNGGHYPDPTPAQAFKRMHKTGVLREAKLEEMDSLRPQPLTLDTISEAEGQTAVITWAKYHEWQYPALRWLHHIPNGGSRHPAEAVTLKRMGVKAGVPDLCLPFSSHGYHGLYIEMKSEKGRVTALQKEWLEGLSKNGYKTVVCFSAESAISELESYLQVDS